LEAIYRDYKNKNVDFYFVYKALAHPQSNGFVGPTSLKERLLHAERAKQSLGTTIPWLVDSMDNQLKHAMGDRNNSEFIIDPNGRIVRMRDWSNPQLVRSDLVELVGPVNSPTDPRTLNLRMDFGLSEVAHGVVDRVQREGQMAALRVETITGSHPAYVKLRAEADAALMRQGKGKLYLGFFVDPIHRVHWNNLAGPVTVEVNGTSHVGPRVTKADADVDPREFVVDVSTSKPINVKIMYTGCDDKETWCRELNQEFVVSLEFDRDAGRVFDRADAGRGPGVGRGPGGRRGDAR
jgi:hypothetical protein